VGLCRITDSGVCRDSESDDKTRDRNISRPDPAAKPSNAGKFNGCNQWREEGGGDGKQW